MARPILTLHHLSRVKCLCPPPAPSKAGLTQLWRSWQIQCSDAHECNLMNSFLSRSSMRVKPIPSRETSTCYVLCSPHPTSLAAPWKIPFPRALSEWLPPRNSRAVHVEDRTPAHPPCAETAETFVFSVQSTPWPCSGTSHERLSLSLGETGNSNGWVHLYLRYPSLFTVEAFFKRAKECQKLCW